MSDSTQIPIGQYVNGIRLHRGNVGLGGMIDFSALLAAIEENTAVQRRIAEALEGQRSSNARNYYTPEEAAEKLGFKVTATGSHTRRLKYCRDKGFLNIWYSERPYHYDRDQVEALAEKLRKGKVYLPKSF
jgi:hypothetical protein